MAIRTYDILLDSYNSTMPEPIVGRQGDKNGAVTLHVTITDRGTAVDLTDQTVNLIAETANGTAVVADNAGVTLTDAANGRFDYAIPNALWSEAGKITKAYFSLNAAGGQQTTYDLIFIVKKAIDVSKKTADDYITIIDDTLNSLKKKIDAAAVPETFANLAAIQAKYPNGKNGIMIAADNGHKYIWSNGKWTDAGVYQAAGIADGSVTPENLNTSYVPNNKKSTDYSIPSQATDLYIINDVISESGIVNVTGKFTAGSVVIFLLEKKGTFYTVKEKYSTIVTEGWQSLPTNFYATGDGNEYIGIVGKIYFNTTGGNGFYNVVSADVNAEYFNTNKLISNYDFSLFCVYENIDIVKKLEDTSNKVNDETKLNFTNNYKDLTGLTTPSALKNFVDNKPLDKGNVIAHVAVTSDQIGKIYVVERNGVNFTVKRKLDVTLTTGINTFDLNYETTGSGIEYLGVYAQINLSASGGNGFFETPNEDTSSYNEGDTFTTVDRSTPPTTGYSYNLAMYAEYSRPLKEVVNENKENIDEINNLLPTISLDSYKTPKYSNIDDSVGFVGRWFDAELNGVPVKATINEGSEFYFKVKNTTMINVNFVLNSVKATPYFAYSIDGIPMTRQLITTSKLPTVTKNEHIVRVVIDGLTESEDKWFGEKGVAFKNVTVDAGGVVTGIVPKNRQILFHGDSITEGVRVLNINADSTGNSATGAFPYIASEKLNAISYRVGFGASGITQGGSGGVPELIQVIDKMTNAREAPYIEPDVVVMNMGTNDKAATTEVFTTKLNEVLDRLSIKYSGTPIFVMVPFNQTRKTELTNAVSARNNMHLVETEGWNITTTDGTHPNTAGGLIAGKKLANAIISVLGKDYFI